MDYTTYGATSAANDFSPTTMLLFVIVGLAIYIYAAYCVYTIAKKTNTPNEVLAWIPIANLYLMVKIAKVSMWWLLGLVIPYLNIIAIAYVWWKISEVRNRPGWWGIVMLISPVNLVLLYFLAFKEASSQPSAAPMPPQQTV